MGGTIQERLPGACADRIQLPLRPAIEIVEFGGSRVVVAEIDPPIPAHRPYFIAERGMYQRSYIRSGDGDRRLSRYEIDRLVKDAEAVDRIASIGKVLIE